MLRGAVLGGLYVVAGPFFFMWAGLGDGPNLGWWRSVLLGLLWIAAIAFVICFFRLPVRKRPSSR